MRAPTIVGTLIALPLLALPASAQNNWTDQAARLLNPNAAGQNAYERGREDQARQEQFHRDQRRAARQEQRYRDQQYGYRNPYYDR